MTSKNFKEWWYDKEPVFDLGKNPYNMFGFDHPEHFKICKRIYEAGYNQAVKELNDRKCEDCKHMLKVHISKKYGTCENFKDCMKTACPVRYDFYCKEYERNS